MNTKITCLFLLLAVIVGSCKDDDNPTSPSGLIYSYFPTNTGHEVIYDVSLITKNAFDGSEDTSIYQIKEVIEATFLDDEGRPSQRLERFRRDNPNDAWVISDVWTSTRTNTKAEKKEENVTYVKMVFPINYTVEWNGNSLNTEEPLEYSFDNIHQPDFIGGINFDSTLTVNQQNDKFHNDIFYKIEKFAPGVGLIYKEDNTIEFQKPQVGIKSQSLYKETIVSWSN